VFLAERCPARLWRLSARAQGQNCSWLAVDAIIEL